MRKKMSKKAIAIALVATVVLGGAGAAFAYWTNSGSGSDTATAGTSVAVTYVQTTNPVNLRPAGTPQPLAGTVTNPNDGPVYITTLTGTIASVMLSDGTTPGTEAAGSCSPLDFQIIGDDLVTGKQVATTDVRGEVADTDDTTWDGLSIAFKNDTARNQDACKLAVVTITYAGI